MTLTCGSFILCIHLNFFMKIILCLIFLVSYAYPQLTGNDFLRDYPFNKEDYERGPVEVKKGIIYESYRESNTATVTILHNIGQADENSFNFSRKLCNISDRQLIRMVKKWCDENPHKTHHRLSAILFDLIFSLPDDNCE